MDFDPSTATAIAPEKFDPGSATLATAKPDVFDPSSAQVLPRPQPMDIGNQLRTAYDFQVNPAELFKPFEGARQVIESIIPSPPAETEAMRLTGIKHVPTTAETVALKGKGALETIASPGGVLLGAAGMVAPEIVGPVMAATALPQVGQGVSEIAQGKVAAGAADLALAVPMLAGAAAPFAIREAPITARVMESGKEALSKAVEAGGETAAKSESAVQAPEIAAEVPITPQEITPQSVAESWLLDQQKNAAQTPLGSQSPDAALKVVSEWIRSGETPAGPIPGEIQDALMRSLGATRDLETGETLDISSPDWPRTGTLIDFLDKQANDRLPAEPEKVAPTAEVSFPEPSIEPVKPMSEGPVTPLSLALDAQREAGWNTKWPFVPADLLNADFRKAISEDPALSLAEKTQIFGAGEKLGVVPKGETPTPISQGPGAASPGDVPGGSQLSQLTKAIEPTVPVEKPLLAGVKNDFTRAYEQLSDKAESALTRLKSFGSQAMAALKGEAKWTDFKDALGKFSGELNRNSYELQQFTKEVRRVIPDRLRREAIVNWIQADGDTALLRERESISKPDLRSGYKVAQSLTPDEMTLAGNVRSYLDAKLQEGIDAGLLKAGIENYVTQLWDRPNPIVNKLIGEVASGKLSTNFKFARKRIFDSYFEGEQAGFKPKLKDIGALTAIYDQSFSRAIAGRKLIKALHEGKATDGLPLVEVSGVSNLLSEGGEPQAVLIKPKVKPADLAGYKPIDHPALRGWKWAGTDENGAPILYQGDMVVHPEIYGHLKNVLSSSALRQNAFFRGVLEAQAILKQSKLALSGFHFTQEGTHAAAHRVNPFAPGKVDFSVPDQSALVDHGLQVADYHAYQAFSEGVSGAGSIYERIPTVGKWLTRYNEYLFQEYIPRLKMSMAMDALERNRERFAGKLSDDQILELTANQSNAAFGALNYDMLGRNKTLQDFIRMAALAPDFLEARFRFAAQALTKTGTEQRVALALQAATLYTGARILNQALDGDPHWEPKYAFDVVYNKRQYGIRSVVEDAMHFATDPAKFISNRMAPIMKAAVEFTTGRDWRGVKRTSLEQLKDLADWLLPITADRQADRTKLDTALAASGVTVRSATAQQRLYDQLRQFKESNNLISRDEKIGMTSPSEYGPLRNALTVANDAAAKREYEALLHPTDGTKPKTPTQIREHFISSVRAPFSGSQRVEMQFLKSLDKKGNDLYLEARQERKELAQKFIEKQRQWMSEGKK